MELCVDVIKRQMVRRMSRFPQGGRGEHTRRDRRFPTPYAGANRFRFEGLRLPALSAQLRSPVVLKRTLVAALHRRISTTTSRLDGTSYYDGPVTRRLVTWMLLLAAIAVGIVATPSRADEPVDVSIESLTPQLLALTTGPAHHHHRDGAQQHRPGR